jgi:NADH/NAD ratio-sensing transcriptional regulator Rex
LKWIDKIFGNKESRRETISLEKLPEWLDSKSRKISQETSGEVSAIYPEIQKTLIKIKNSTAELEKSNPEGRFHLKLVKIAASNRDNMAKQVKMLLENIIIPKDKNVKTIIAFHESGMQTLGVCLENMMKSYQYTKLVYFEESKNVIADVNSLGRLLNQLMEPINSKKLLLDALDRSQELVSTIRNITVDIDSMEKTIEENDVKSVSLKKEIDEKQKSLNILLQSEPWKQYVSSKDHLVLLEEDAEKKSSEINGIISPLIKAINRLKQLSDSARLTLSPQDREALNLCLSCPVDVPPEFFVTFQKIVESGDLNLPKMDKLLPQIQLAASTLGEKRKEYYSIRQDIERKNGEISNLKIIGEEKDLRKALSNLQDKLMITEKELEASRKKLELLIQDLGSKKNELQQNITVIDSNKRLS